MYTWAMSGKPHPYLEICTSNWDLFKWVTLIPWLNWAPFGTVYLGFRQIPMHLASFTGKNTQNLWLLDILIEVLYENNYFSMLYKKKHFGMNKNLNPRVKLVYFQYAFSETFWACEDGGVMSECLCFGYSGLAIGQLAGHRRVRAVKET